MITTLMISYLMMNVTLLDHFNVTIDSICFLMFFYIYLFNVILFFPHFVIKLLFHWKLHMEYTKCVSIPIIIFSWIAYLPFARNAQEECPSRKKHKGKKKVSSNLASKSIVEVQTKKPKLPNWEHGEILALVKVKRDEHIATLNKVNPRDQFKTTIVKWKVFFY
jgi:hypothetical protein